MSIIFNPAGDWWYAEVTIEFLQMTIQRQGTCKVVCGVMGERRWDTESLIGS